MRVLVAMSANLENQINAARVLFQTEYEWGETEYKTAGRTVIEGRPAIDGWFDYLAFKIHLCRYSPQWILGRLYELNTSKNG